MLLSEPNTPRGHPTEPSFEANSYYNDVSLNIAKLFGANILDCYTSDDIMAIVKDPMGRSKEARELSRALYSCNGIVTNTIDYMTALPTLSNVVVPYGDNPKKKRAVKKAAANFLDIVRDKEFVRDAIHGVLVDGEYFAYLEIAKRSLNNAASMTDYDVDHIVEINSTEMNANFISLDPDYTRIVGIKNGSYILACDLEQFRLKDLERAEEKLKKYPVEIRKAFEKWKAGTGKRWAVLDTAHTIAIKYRAKRSEPHGRPAVLAAIDDILYDNYLTNVKRKALRDTNNRVVLQTFPEGKEKGMSALTDKQQERQHQTVRDAIVNGSRSQNGSTTVISVAAGTKVDVLKSEVSTLENSGVNTMKNGISMALGFAGSLLSGEGTSSFSAQENNLKLVTAQVFNIIEAISYELDKVINACIVNNKNYRVHVQYLPITYANSKEFAGLAKELYLQGKGSLSLWASAVGISADAFFSLLDDELEMDAENKYPVHQTSYTQTAPNGAGRPVDEDTTNDHTANTRANGGDNTPRPGSEVNADG